MSSAIDFIHDTSFDGLLPGLADEAIRCLADTLGVAAGGSCTQLSRIIRNHAARQFAGGRSAIWWDGRVASPAGAALANGMTIDALDAHDGHKLTKGHVGCGVIPGLIAVMQEEGETCPRELLTSIVIGYEIGTRAGIALHASASDYHTSGAWVALAVAALGARQLGLTTSQTREALGIAEYHGPRSQMMRCIDHPTMVKDGSGWGAMAGVSAAYLAADGFTGAPAVTVDSPALDHVWSDLGQTWRIREQYIKLYPVCRWAQPAVEAVLALKHEHGFEAKDVAAVSIATFHEAKRLATIPDNTEQAQYSLPFPVAAALVRGALGVDEVTGSGLHDREIRRMAQMIEITETDEFNAAFPASRLASATIRLRDGREVTSGATQAKGDPEHRLPDKAVWSKFDALTRPVLGAERSGALRDCIAGLKATESNGQLFEVLAADASGSAMQAVNF